MAATRRLAATRGATCRTRSKRRPARSCPVRRRASAAAWLGARWPRSRAFPRPLRLGNVLENLGRDPAGAYYADLCFLKPQDARALLGKAPTRDPADSPVYEQVTRPYRECPSDSAVQRAQYADLKIYMPNDPLVKVDRMSMANSLEIRCPLLDHKLVELAFQIPTRNKMPNGEPKSLLRSLAARRLPKQILTLPKRGFTAPIGSWLAGPYADQFRDDVLGAVIAIARHRRYRARGAAVRGTSRRTRRSRLRAVGGLDARALGAPRSRAHGARLTPCFAPSSSSSR